MPKYAKHGLTGNQLAFCREYLRNGCNGTRAAIAAGYSAKSASSLASEMLRKPKIAAQLARGLELKGVVPESVKNLYAEHMHGDVADYAPWIRGERTLEELRDIDGIDTRIIRSATVSRVVKEGRGGSITTTNRKLELYDAQSASGQMAKVLGLVTDKKEVHHSGLITAKAITDMSPEEMSALAHAADADTARIVTEVARLCYEVQPGANESLGTYCGRVRVLMNAPPHPELGLL